MGNKFILPDNSQHLAVVGKNGSGKTVAGVWHLSQKNVDKFPWVVLDFKRDELINSIPHVQEIDMQTIPNTPGVFVMHPFPNQQEEVDAYLWNVLDRENVGIFVDEGYMLQKSKAFEAILTQGRSKRIPVIALSQRPVWVSRFVWSESTFMQIFWLNDIRDRDTIGNFIPVERLPEGINTRLPEHYSLWYDVKQDYLTPLKPVPAPEVILSIFDNKLKGVGPKKIFI